MRLTALHFLPSVEVLITISFELQPLRKRQSHQITYAFPAASIRSGGQIREAAEVAIFRMVVTLEMTSVELQVLPPSVERKASMPPPENGTMTVPLG